MEETELVRVIDNACVQYVTRWKSTENTFINVPDFQSVYIENTFTPIERELLVLAVLGAMHKEEPGTPGSFPDLPHAAICHLPASLTRTLEIQINPDHYHYWAWSAEVLLSRELALPLLNNARVLETPLRLLFHTVLASFIRPPHSRAQQQLNRVLFDLVPSNVQEMVYGKMLLAAPLAFLCFEMVVRQLCSDYVTNEGRAAKEINLPERKYKVGSLITLRPLLRVFQNFVVPTLPPAERDTLTELHTIIETVWGRGLDWIDLVADQWRNSLLHGRETWLPRAFGVITNYTCLLLWYALAPEDYESACPKIIAHVNWTQNTGQGAGPRGYYPPEV